MSKSSFQTMMGRSQTSLKARFDHSVTKKLRSILIKYLVSAVFVPLAMAGRSALADEGLANFKHVATPVSDANSQADWGPVPTENPSIANVAPGLLTYFNNGPVFGLPGTKSGDLWDRTQLTGDWDGYRTDLAEHGVFIDIYSTTAYQDVTSGGLQTGDAWAQNTQLSINLDTERAGLWSGGLFHVTVQSRYGVSPQKTFSVGTYVPQYTGFVHPDPLISRDTLPTEYFLAQAISQQFSVVLGKISDVFIPDETLLGDSYKYYFANFNFNKNPMTTNFYNPTALAALGIWTPTNWFALGGGVLDPNSKANNLATHAFDRVNLYLTAVISYNVGDLPGQLSPSVNWSNKPKIDLASPFGSLSSGQIPGAVDALLGVSSSGGLPVNYKRNSGFVIANFSQYLFVMDDAATTAQELKSGQPIRGVGIFGRLGYAPKNSNTLTRDYSVALFARGIFDSRPEDSFGVGYYYDGVSTPFKSDISELTGGTKALEDEKGLEVFYDFAITPAIRLTPSYQHIWNPLIASVANSQKSADVLLARFNLAL